MFINKLDNVKLGKSLNSFISFINPRTRFDKMQIKCLCFWLGYIFSKDISTHILLHRMIDPLKALKLNIRMSIISLLRHYLVKKCIREIKVFNLIERYGSSHRDINVK